ncbi:Coniferyl aldehyde dehydrogenase [BD1-7 clade bacterium]|uniref:Aldehyde dehydrogenase n=1 Tax=BD1-7 clade bacterium TaxID=2029982 RepID=A0A5S9QM63_9GAMM|nr:Coniferyl aldehyde dehydrogenase [BD1-7 clade bacterium]
MDNKAVQLQNNGEITTAHLNNILQKQQAAFAAEGFVTYETRLDRLNRLEALLHENIDALVTTMSEDFGHRSPHQSRIADFYGTFECIKHTKKHLKKWMKDEKRNSPFPLGLLGARSKIQYQPKGVIGNITTWNFPVGVACTPLAGILAAGNRCMVKLTEVTPATSELLKTLFTKYFDETEVIGITGGPEVGAAFSSLPLDHIIFTGATSIGRHILRGAADNLTPVTLELGGKSPVVIGRSADLQESALRIFTGKALNVGQVCISPDYIFVAEEQLDTFLEMAIKHVSTMFPTMLSNGDYSSVINERHYQRLQSYLQDASDNGADVREINPANEDFTKQTSTHKIPLTIVVNPDDSLKVMQEEIFGPIISVKTYKHVDDAIKYINANSHPLALYYFGDDKAEEAHILNTTTSGGVSINDVVAHAGVEELPFGGIGPSGMGNYHGFEGFKTFSHAKSIFRQSKNVFMMKHTGMIPPYNDSTEKALAFMLKRRK